MTTVPPATTVPDDGRIRCTTSAFTSGHYALMASDQELCATEAENWNRVLGTATFCEEKDHGVREGRGWYAGGAGGAR